MNDADRKLLATADELNTVIKKRAAAAEANATLVSTSYSALHALAEEMEPYDGMILEGTAQTKFLALREKQANMREELGAQEKAYNETTHSLDQRLYAIKETLYQLIADRA